VAEEGRGGNEVAQPVNPAANVVANAPANPVANAPANNPVNAAGNVINNVANAANVQANIAPNPRHNAGAHPPPVQANRVEGSQRHHIRDEAEIARVLTTTVSMESLTPLTPTTPFNDRGTRSRKRFGEAYVADPPRHTFLEGDLNMVLDDQC
jgi:hypothetical protein